MKMQLRKILILPAIGDQTICREVKFIHKSLDGGKQIGKKSCVRGIEIRQGGDGFLGHEQHMKWIGRLRVMERQQGVCFVQSSDRDRETHMRKNPANQMPDPGMP